jgi:predicted aconitase with swiveling domain
VGGLTMKLCGQVVVAGEGRGVALATREPLSLWGGLDPATGEIIDLHHPLSGQSLTGRVLVLPHGRGSCSASGVLLEAIVNGTGPAAILTTRPDPIIGLGSILADELYRLSVPVVVIAEAEAGSIETGQMVAVRSDGVVMVDPAGPG